MFTIKDLQAALNEPLRTGSSAWLEHIPFAFALIELHRPGILVELGTHTGAAYFAFCQIVAHLRLPTKCYAVDTWTGDEHSGFYGEGVFSEVSEYNNTHYSHFSSLMRMPFDEALQYFTNGTVDLIHIDGHHTYDSVKHDFDSWLPKASERAIVILHDTRVKERGFGVWRLFEQLRSDYPTFEFTHGCGLGVVAIGAAIPQLTSWQMFQRTEEESALIRRYFSVLGARVAMDSRVCDLEAQLEDLQRDLEAVTNSTSWQVTKPLRIMKRFLRIRLCRQK